MPKLRQRAVLLWFGGILLGSVAFVVGAIAYFLYGPLENGIPVGPETTIYDGPLDDEGYVDYGAALFGGSRIPPEENAAACYALPLLPKLRKTFEPDVFAGVCEDLGIEPLADKDNPWLFVEFSKDLLPAEQQESDEAAAQIFEDFDHCQTTPWTAEQYPLVAQWLSLNEKAIEITLEGTRRPKFEFLPRHTGLLSEILLPLSQYQTGLARLLATRAMQRLGEGDVAGATNDVDAIHRLARHRQPYLISYRTAVRNSSIAFQAEKAIILQLQTAQELHQRQKALRQFQPLNDVSAGIHDACVTTLECVQQWDRYTRRLALAPGAKNNCFPEEVFDKDDYSTLGRQFLFRRTDFGAVSSRIVEWHRDLASLFELPHADRITALERLDDLPSPPDPTWRSSQDEIAEYVVSKLVTPYVLVGRDIGKETTRQMLLDVLIAARMFELETSQIAKSPDDLVPRYLDQWPENNIDGQPLEHRLADNVWTVYAVDVDDWDYQFGATEKPEISDVLSIDIGPRAE